MNPPDDRADPILKAIFEMSDRAAREAFIAKTCKDELALEARVRRLLEAREHAGAVLDGVPISAEVEMEMACLKPEETGERIGHYRLWEQIGANLPIVPVLRSTGTMGSCSGSSPKL